MLFDVIQMKALIQLAQFGPLWTANVVVWALLNMISFGLILPTSRILGTVGTQLLEKLVLNLLQIIT